MEFEILMAAITKKHEEDMEDIKCKHKSNLDLIETKFKTENDILNQEFLFLSQELEKMRSIQQNNALKSPNLPVVTNLESQTALKNNYQELLVKKNELEVEEKRIVH